MGDGKSFLIHESRIDKLKAKFEQLNSSVKNGSNIDYMIVGEEFQPYTDKSGRVTDKSRYFKVALKGNVVFDNMTYLGIADVDSNAVIPYGDITRDEFFKLANKHDRSCACCNKERNRKELYFFKCNNDMTDSKGNQFQAGEVYTVGSTCVDEFAGTKALSILKDLSGTFDNERIRERAKDASPKYVEPKRFAAYVIAVGASRLDDLMRSDYRNFKDAVKSGETHRRLYKSNTSYGVEGTIAKTARAAYFLNEYGYAVPPYDEKGNADRFKEFMEKSGFLKIVNNANVNSVADKIIKDCDKDFEKDSLTQTIQTVNAGKVLNSRRIHSSHVQMIVDACDGYYLEHHSGLLHEESKPRYTVGKKSYIGYPNWEYAVGEIRRSNPYGKDNYTDVRIGLQFGNHRFNQYELAKLFDGDKIPISSVSKAGKPYHSLLQLGYDREAKRYRVCFCKEGDQNGIKPLVDSNERLARLKQLTPKQESMAKDRVMIQSVLRKAAAMENTVQAQQTSEFGR